MQLRTKLLSTFTVMILLASVIAYTGYNSLITMKSYQEQSDSCNSADSWMLGGWVEGSNFLLYKDFERLKKAEASFKKAIEYLAKTQELSFTKENKDASADLIKSIQEAEQSYHLLGEKWKKLTEINKQLAESSKSVVTTCMNLAKTLAKTEYAEAVVAMLSEFSDIRILNYRFDITPTEEIQKEVITKTEQFISDTQKYMRIFAADYNIHGLLKQMVAGMENYKNLTETYTTSVLFFHKDTRKCYRLKHF